MKNHVHVFFYGLFMDEGLLQQKGITPISIQKGHLDDYTLSIGNRASLIPKPGARSYGLLMEVDKHAMHELYAEESVADYIREDVNVVSTTGDRVQAICYNLPQEAMDGTNSAYAKALWSLAEKLNFPASYLAHIKGMFPDGEPS